MYKFSFLKGQSCRKYSQKREIFFFVTGIGDSACFIIDQFWWANILEEGDFNFCLESLKICFCNAPLEVSCFCTVRTVHCGIRNI